MVLQRTSSTVLLPRPLVFFKWVVLAVRSLPSGLRDYDTISDLRRKLDELPPDLETLYEHMLGNMSHLNRRQGSKLLQLVIRNLEIHDEYPITALQLSFAENDDYAKAFLGPLSKLSDQQLAWRYEATEGRMRSRCCGLIEVQKPMSSSEGNPDKTVVFFHNPVVECVRLPVIWKELTSLTSGTGFDVDVALVSSSLCEMSVQSEWHEREGMDLCLSISMLRYLSHSDTYTIQEIYFMSLWHLVSGLPQKSVHCPCTDQPISEWRLNRKQQLAMDWK